MLLALSVWIVPTPAHAKAITPEITPIVTTVAEVKEPTVEDIQPKSIAHKDKIQPKRVEPLPVQGIYNGRNYSKEEVIQLIKDYSEQYGINPAVPLCVAQRESSFNQFSRNKSSSASGVFQYLNATWKATDEGKSGLSVYDADANVKAAVKYMASRKSTSPWIQTATHCPKLVTLN